MKVKKKSKKITQKVKVIYRNFDGWIVPLIDPGYNIDPLKLLQQIRSGK